VREEAAITKEEEITLWRSMMLARVLVGIGNVLVLVFKLTTSPPVRLHIGRGYKE
jgi:hypothetical protein